LDLVSRHRGVRPVDAFTLPEHGAERRVEPVVILRSQSEDRDRLGESIIVQKPRKRELFSPFDPTHDADLSHHQHSLEICHNGPERLRSLDALEHRQPRIRGAREHGQVVRVGHGSSGGLQLTRDELVEVLILRDIRLKELIRRDAVRLDERLDMRDIERWVRVVVHLALSDGQVREELLHRFQIEELVRSIHEKPVHAQPSKDQNALENLRSGLTINDDVVT